jgi:hypothetical protein
MATAVGIDDYKKKKNNLKLMIISVGQLEESTSSWLGGGLF